MRLQVKRLTINLIMYALIATSSGAIVYLKLNTVHERAMEQQQQDSDQIVESYRGHMSQLSQYIKSLKSRVQHLAMDNKRLSKAGNKLVDSMQEHSADLDVRRETKETLQNELSEIYASIIEKYGQYVVQQENTSDLKVACKKGSSKSKKCEEYQESLNVLDGIASQIKYLKVKRDVLISNIERTGATL